ALTPCSSATLRKKPDECEQDESGSRDNCTNSPVGFSDLRGCRDKLRIRGPRLTMRLTRTVQSCLLQTSISSRVAALQCCSASAKVSFGSVSKHPYRVAETSPEDGSAVHGACRH